MTPFMEIKRFYFNASYPEAFIFVTFFVTISEDDLTKRFVVPNDSFLTSIFSFVACSTSVIFITFS